MSSDEGEFEYGSDDGEQSDFYEAEWKAEDVEQDVKKLKLQKACTDYDMKAAFLPPVEELQAVRVLNDTQTKALQHVASFARPASERAKELLKTRFDGLGYSTDILDSVLLYIRDTAPIIVHIPATVVTGPLVKDTDLRNGFETGSSPVTFESGERTSWEAQMFNNVYTAAPGYDRVKYGSMNITRDPNGVRCCAAYGDCFLELKGVRLRSTFASGDTASSDVQQNMAMCEYYAHVLQTFTDEEIRAVTRIALGEVDYLSSDVVSQFKEVAVHGPVILKQHVAALNVPATYKTNSGMKKTFEEFAKINECALRWMDEGHTGADD